MAAERQPDAKPRLALLARARLSKPLKQAGEEAGLDPLAVVGHDRLDLLAVRQPPQMVAVPANAERHLAALGRELHRIRQQVPQHLLEAPAIEDGGTEVRRDLQLDADVLAVGIGKDHVHGGPHHLRDRVGAQVEGDPSRLQAGEIAQILDQLLLALRAADDRVDRVGHVGGRHGPAAQRARPQQDRRQRRAQLVAQGDEEFVLGAVGPFRLGVGRHGLRQQDLPLLLDLLLFAEVPQHLGEADQRAVIVDDRRGQILRPELGVVAAPAPAVGAMLSARACQL